MTYLSEDPWPLAGALGLIGLGFLVVLRFTQQGKFLLWAGIALGLALVVIGIERFWVTDNERIEDVVYDVARAVQAGDADGVAKHLAPEAEVTLDANLSGGDRFLGAILHVMGRLQGLKLNAEAIRHQLQRFRFDYVKIGRISTNAGAQSRLGTAEFRVHVFGEQLDPFHTIATPASGMGWSFGFRETEPKVWKITRITPTSTLAELQEGGGPTAPTAPGPNVATPGRRGRRSTGPSGRRRPLKRG